MTTAPGTAAGASCGATCGVTRERERQKQAARAVAARAYPDLVWASKPAWRPDDAPVDHRELNEIAAALETILPARAMLRMDDRAECDAIHLLAGLHAPSLLEVREQDQWAGVERVHDSETYLRVAISPVGRYYSLQEVRLRCESASDGIWVEEQRCVGVEDRRLQTFVKAAQGYLRKRKIVGLDAAFLAEPIADPDGAGCVATGAPPTLWTVLFEPMPPGAIRGDLVPHARATI